MNLVHEFYLVSQPMDAKQIWMLRESNNVIDTVTIHDDMIQYILDSLKWIPCKNPAKQGNPSGFGINYYGVTLFDKQSSASLNGIFSSWRDLFKNAPITFELTGNFVV
jgi:hypothetical protein